MNWFHENRWLGTFLIALAVATLGAGYFLWSAKGSADDALAQFNEAAAERGRLERLDPFPNEANYRKMKVYIENYASSLEKLKEDLKTRVLPAPPLAPNEFQSRLRQAMLSVAEKARNNKVKLPENFALGFEEFTAALPNTVAAPLLGQQLSQVEMLMNILIEARVDGINSLTRTPLPEEHGTAPSPTPGPPGARKPPGNAVTTAAGAKMLERSTVELDFAASPSAARKVLNQIGSSTQQFFIARTVHVRNEKDKGPAREQAPQPGATATPPPAPAAKPASNAAISFMVGNEHIETAIRVELIRFTF